MRPTRPPVPLAECRDCGLPIVFVKLDTGKAIPVNPYPDTERGNVAARLLGRNLHGYVISRDHPADPLHLRMIPHAATCEVSKRTTKPPDPPALFE